jgi:nucleotide-binding universal stress UspA family protein
MKKVLIPIDQSEHSMMSFEYADQFYEKYGSEITVLNVQRKMYDSDKPGDEILKRAEEFFKRRDISVVLRSEKSNDTAEKILEISEKEGFDLIIMTSHGMHAGKRLRLGSVTNKVVYHVKIPILVVK